MAYATKFTQYPLVHETQRQMLYLASLISACVFGFLFVYFGLIVDLCLVVWLGRAVSCLPRESEASRTPETLDSPTVDGHQKMTQNKFKIIEITIFKNNFLKKMAPMVSQLKNKSNCRTLMRRSFPQLSLKN